MAKKKVKDMTAEELQLYREKKAEQDRIREEQKTLPIEERDKKYITTKDMLDYIDENCPNEKDWFIKVATEEYVVEKEGKKVIKNKAHEFDSFHAKSEFVKKFFPEKIKQNGKEKKSSDLFYEWAGIKKVSKKK